MIVKFERHQPITESGLKAIDWLVQAVTDLAQPLSKTELKATMQKGAVWLSRGRSTERLRRASRVLQPGDELHLYYDARVLKQSSLEPQLIADEGEYSVWNKPCGMLCQGSKYGDHTTLYRWAETRLQPQRPAFIVHRLDRATSGLVLLAHSKASARRLTQLFESRQVDKRYRAIVQGDLAADDLLVDQTVDGKVARSRVTRLDYDKQRQLSLIEVKLETGRKHQIRLHLSGLGHPIVGDRLYGQGDQDGCDLQLRSSLIGWPLNDQQHCYQLESAAQLTLEGLA